MSWSGSNLVSSGGMNISSGATVTSSFSSSLVGGTITNAGTFSPSDMGVNNGTINNLASGYVNVGTSWFAGTGTNLLRNSGTILASFGTFSSSSTLSIPLVNSGTIVATSLGTINFSTLTFSGGSFTHLDGAVLKGAGSGFLDLGSFSSTSHTFAGNVTILGSVFMSGAVIGGPGDMNIGGSSGSGGFSLGSGTIGGSGAINIATNGAFGGAGTVSRSVNNAGTFSQTSGSITLVNSILTNSGTIMLGASGSFSSAGTITLNAGTIHNLANGTIFLNRSGVPLTTFGSGSTSALVNSGWMQVNPGSTSFITTGVQFDNDGTINVQSGTFQFGSSFPATQNPGAWLGGAGTIDLSGTQTINGPVTLAGPNLRLASGFMTNNGNTNLTGSMGWSGGTIQGPGTLSVASGGTLTITSGATPALNSNVNNSGVVTVGFPLNIGSLNSLSNLSGGVLNLASSNPFTSAGTVRNSGTISFNPISPLSSSTLTIRMINNGTISAGNGSLLFGVGTFTHNDGAIITGSGFVDLGFAGSALHLLNGTLTLAGNNIAMTNGTITGSGNLEVTGPFAWNGGTISTGSLTNDAAMMNVRTDAVLSVSSFGSTRTLSRVLNNSGIANINGSITLSTGTINNLAGGVMNITASMPFAANTGSLNLVTNAGTINVSSTGGGSVLFTQPTVNSGTINVTSGSLVFSGTITHSGNSMLTGAGVINFTDASPATHVIDGTLTLAAALTRLSNATLSGDGDVIVTKLASWGFGTIKGNGQLTVAPTGSFVISNSTFAATLSRAFNNAGTTSLLGGTLTLSNGTITNSASMITALTPAGSFNVVAGAGQLNRFVNTGTVDVQGGTLSIAVPFSNTGKLVVDGTGKANLTGAITQVVGPTLTRGTWIVNDAATLNMGGASITNNAANVTLNGPGSSFDVINPLSNNSGTFQLLGGRAFATSAGFTNSGRIVVGASSVLTINGDLTNTGTIDMGGVMVVNYSNASPISDIAAQIASGFAGGSWNGIGINSTPAALVAADLSNPHKTGVGYADASALGIVGTGTLAGQPVDDTSVVVRYTLLGDTNLDGVVNAVDFNALASNFGGDPGKTWINGDANYDGVVNTADFNALASNFNQPLAAPALGGLVPEPGILILAALIPISGRRRAGKLKSRPANIFANLVPLSPFEVSGHSR
jgi:hypothetical protein